MIEALVSDFGGVLTSPLIGSFARFQEESGIALESLGQAMVAIERRDGAHPLFELECGRMTEAAFLATLGDELGVPMHAFADRYWEALDRNEEMLDYLATLRQRGVRLALLTNNVREWEPRWRRMIAVDELFEVVVDSAFVGMRKPDPRIYELTCARLGVAAPACLFVDDIELNCDAARAVGMRVVWFRDSAQAIAELEAQLSEPSRSQR